ncbi:7937_t:CDS:2, partial [Paraglomus occultum]
MEKPDALILIGPFVSQTRSTRMSPQAIFSAYISKPLEVFCSISPKTTVILVPSLEDKIYQPATFPQSAMTARSLKIPESVYSLPNPCSFQLNGIGIGVCTIDLLEHVAKEEVTKGVC